jgi:hypothetical protein
VLWELGEYLTFLRTNEEERATLYTDTIGDMTFGLTGSLLAAAAIYAVARRQDAVRDDLARHPV